MTRAVQFTTAAIATVAVLLIAALRVNGEREMRAEEWEREQ